MSYLQPRQLKPIPETAAAVFASREFYRQLVANLELMANWYNKVMKTLLEVEFPLVEEELRNIDLRLRAAEDTLNWKTEGNWAPPGWGKVESPDCNKSWWAFKRLPGNLGCAWNTACPQTHTQGSEGKAVGVLLSLCM